MASGQPTLKDLNNHIVTKASKDDAFRQKLIADPAAAINAELAASFPTAGKVPAKIKINVVEQSASNVYIVLPPKSKKAGELNDAELEAVAGGGVITGCLDDYGTENDC
ncbi:MAG: NHLP leader peptide family RiPP precursor [Verrucomicrobiota bacterium]